VRRADYLTTFMCRLSWNLGVSTYWNTPGYSSPVMGLLYFFTKEMGDNYPYVLSEKLFCSTAPSWNIYFSMFNLDDEGTTILRKVGISPSSPPPPFHQQHSFVSQKTWIFEHKITDQPRGLVIRVSDYWSWGPGFNFRFYYGDFSLKRTIPMVTTVWVV
jgi:hypothetical protein